MCRCGTRLSLLHDWTEWSNFEVQTIDPMRIDPMSWVTIPDGTEWPMITIIKYWQRRRCQRCGHEAVRRIQ